VRLLVDTHVILWGYSEPTRVSRAALAAITSRQNECFVSLASLWEIALKARKGQLSPPDDLPEQIRANPQLRLLSITAEHAWGVRKLPRLHGDPFDQMLISQALCERLTLVTHDRLMANYGVPVLEA
jgi:PIN domain nuclease of toxin-antitoxin system